MDNGPPEVGKLDGERGLPHCRRRGVEPFNRQRDGYRDHGQDKERLENAPAALIARHLFTTLIISHMGRKMASARKSTITKMKASSTGSSVVARFLIEASTSWS